MLRHLPAMHASREPSHSTSRALLLETASAIMREGDIVDVSLAELSQRSGLNSALVKYHFGNKAGLLSALLDRDWIAIVESVDALVSRDGWRPEAKLRRHISKVIDTFYAVPYLNQLTMRMVRDSAPAEAARIAELYLKPISNVYEMLIAQGIKAGKFRKIDPQFFYFTVTGAADRFYSSRLVLRHCYNQDDFDENMRDAYREHTIDLIMRGLLA